MANYKVGQALLDKIRGIPHEATIGAVLETTDGLKLQGDYGNDQTALVSLRQVVQRAKAECATCSVCAYRDHLQVVLSNFM